MWAWYSQAIRNTKIQDEEKKNMTQQKNKHTSQLPSKRQDKTTTKNTAEKFPNIGAKGPPGLPRHLLGDAPPPPSPRMLLRPHFPPLTPVGGIKGMSLGRGTQNAEKQPRQAGKQPSRKMGRCEASVVSHPQGGGGYAKRGLPIWTGARTLSLAIAEPIINPAPQKGLLR